MPPSFLEAIIPQTARKTYLAPLWLIPVAVLLIVGLTLGWVTYDKYQQTLEAEYRLLEAHARYSDVRIGVALNEAGHLLDKIADGYLESRAARDRLGFDMILARYRHDNPQVVALFVTDRKGRIISATDAALMGRDVSHLEFFAASQDPADPLKMRISRPGKALGDAIAVTFTRKMADGTGRDFAGVAGVVIDTQFFVHALQPVNPGDSGSVSVVINHLGDLFYRRIEPEKFFGRNVAKESQVLREHLRSGAPVTRHIGPSAHDGKTRLFVTRRIGTSGLSAIISRSQDDVLANWQRNLLIHGLIFIFTAAVILFLARVAQRRQHLLQASSEALREAKETAENANAAKSHFLAAASHDLRQPLHALALLVAVLKRRHTDVGSVKIIKPIEEATQALKELLDTLLDISKLDAGVVIPKKQSVSVDNLLGRLESEFAMQVDAGNLKFRVRRTRQAIYTDPTLLMEVLRNLVSNACRNTRHGGILLGCRVRRGALAIQVWDTGKGIPEGELGKIFREYYQVGNPERDRRQGLGLGLSIVERVAKLLGHPVRACSRVGKGSLFEITVPLAGDAPAAVKPSAITAAPIIPLDILVIDDDPVVRQCTAMLLEMLGYHAISAASAVEAVLRIGIRVPDLILADYRLQEGKTGIEAIRTVRAHLGASVPALLVSGDTLPELLGEAKANGLQLLHKPVDPAELDARIKGLVETVSS